MAAFAVVKWKFGEADNDVPASFVRLSSQATDGGLDVLRAGGERLAHYRDVPAVAALERAEVGQRRAIWVGAAGSAASPTAQGIHIGALPARCRADTRV